MSAINPYLTFNGNCEEAFEFYKSVFGGSFLTLMRFDSIPPGDYAPAEEEKNRIMHVALPIGPNSTLMGSDRMAAHGPGTNGDNFSIAFNPDSEAQADQVFNGLAQGGNITMPLAKVFWGAYFGMLTDKYGVNWMVNYEYNKQ
ncbi:VOC family protein [Deminuibacter soli]|uniref:VOC family protein n=1 Tax=Deminuibacter soli TaxID=2291815 RepID=A0A3E1NIM8_9BACT|nr:VOC family protein [Deminuibacter soli]RFM27789.1 VOC family protein [Deminuibacter soli]